MFKPTIWIKNVLQIDADLLKKYGISALILDLDNTLSMNDSPNAEAGVCKWLDSMRSMDIPMIVVSNNTNKRVTPLAGELGLDFFAFGLKPLPFGINRAVKYLKVPRNKIAIVGDQIFTDVLGGSLAGVKTILVEPFHLEKKLSFKLRRKVESLVFDRDFSKLDRF